MRNLIILIFLLVSIVSAQSQSGEIIYVQEKKLKIKMEGMDDAIKNMLPSFSKTKKSLIFNNNKSIYKDVTGDQTQEMKDESIEGTMVVKMKVKASTDELYLDLSENKMVDKKDVFGKEFRIEEDIPEKKWKILNEQKEILGYTCMKASIEKDSTTTIAWFTPQISISTGPLYYYGLPGIILEVNENDGEMICTAAEITLDTNPEVVKPKGGKKVSSEKLAEITEKKMKEMSEMYGGGKNGASTFIIRQNE